LFPSVGWAFDGYHVRADQESFRARRVGHEDVFDRYFLLATPENDLSQSEVERLVAQAGNHDGLVEALSEFKRRGLLTVALDRLDAYKQEIPIERSVSLAAALYDVGEDIGEEFTGFFGMSAATYINRIVLWNLRQEPDVTRRADLLEQAIRQSKGLLLPVRQVSLEDQAHRESKQPEARLLDEIGLQRLKALCVERIVSASVDGSLSRTPRLDNLLYRWRDWAGIEGPQAFTKELASTATGAVQLLAGFVGVMTSQGLGERTVRQTHFIRLKDVEIFIPAAEVEKQIRDLKAAELSEEGGRAVRAFHAALARRARGEPDEPE
jgi:predicted KAP-like P-loop ATPase